jgi:pimeloyl-ACP methyl ester carboxylesterase
VSTYIEQSGEQGPVLVLCHGFGGSARNFRAQARELDEHCRLFAYDARGHARGDAPDDPNAYQPEQFVTEMLGVVDQTNEERVIVGGLSMGAGIALRFALAHPARVAGLVLASFPRSVDDAGHREWALAFADTLETQGVDRAGEQFVWGPSSGFDPKGARLVRQGFREHSAHALAHTLRELLAVQPSVRSLSPELATIAVPTLIVCGSEDPRSLPACRELSRAIAGSELVVIEGGGHVVNLTNPAEFNRALLAWIERIQRQSGPADNDD